MERTADAERRRDTQLRPALAGGGSGVHRASFAQAAVIPGGPPRPPPIGVLRAFGANRPAVPLPGGRRTSWRAGDLVLKPADRGLAELRWEAEVSATVDRPDLRLARPVPARPAAGRPSGTLVVDGWTAALWLPGTWEPRWSEIVAAGERFHAAVAELPRPAFLDQRTDPWAVADRVAWGDRHLEEGAARLPLIAELLALRRPLHDRSQLVQGDLTGNVLFHDPGPPAVIDLAPYWRPTGYAAAIVVADALAWSDAGSDVVEAAEGVARLGQHLIRALLFRVVTDILSGSTERVAAGDAGPYAPVLAVLRPLVAADR